MAEMRELRVGEDVRGPDGERLGEVERIVVDEGAHRVTHLVVESRLVSVGKFRDAGKDGLTLDLGEDALERLPAADLQEVTLPHGHWLAPAGRALDDFMAIVGAVIGQSSYVPPVHTDFAVADEHEITAGSPVWSGQERVGEVEELRLDGGGSITALVVRRAGPTGYRVVVPIARVTELVGNNVHLRVSPEELDALPEP